MSIQNFLMQNSATQQQGEMLKFQDQSVSHIWLEKLTAYLNSAVPLFHMH